MKNGVKVKRWNSYIKVREETSYLHLGQGWLYWLVINPVSLPSRANCQYLSNWGIRPAQRRTTNWKSLSRSASSLNTNSQHFCHFLFWMKSASFIFHLGNAEASRSFIQKLKFILTLSTSRAGTLNILDARWDLVTRCHWNIRYINLVFSLLVCLTAIKCSRSVEMLKNKLFCNVFGASIIKNVEEPLVL